MRVCVPTAISEFDVVVGSGVAGLFSAWHLATDHGVLVVDDDRIGNGTSSRASGLITTPVDYPEQPEWARHAVEFFEEMDETGVFEYTECEFVRGIRADEIERAETVAERESVTLCEPGEYNPWDETFDADSPYEKVLVWDEYTGYFDIDECCRRCSARAWNAAPSSGRTRWSSRCASRTEQRWASRQSTGGSTPSRSSLRRDRERGPCSRTCCRSPSRTSSGTSPTPRSNYRTNTRWVATGESSVRRPTQDGHLIVGIEHYYGDEAPDQGSRGSTRKGTQEAEPSSVRGEDHEQIGPRLERLLNEDLPGRLAHVEPAADIVRWEVCPMADCTTPDARPIVDVSDEGPDGLAVAAGFHGAEVMATKSIGAAVRSFLTNEACPLPREPHRLDRFDTRDTDFEFAPMASWQEQRS